VARHVRESDFVDTAATIRRGANMESKQQVQILDEAWEIVSRAYRLLNQEGLEGPAKELKKEAFSLLNKIKAVRGTMNGFGLKG